MIELPGPQWVLCLVLGCNGIAGPKADAHDTGPPKLLAQRVTATIKRETSRLVRIDTEHEFFLTTSEHPFATPRSGWVAAGDLVPGDRVVSAKFGAVRVSAVHREQLAEPAAVFNLSVDPSHAYLVGTDQVLVHNVKCRSLEERNEEIRVAELELEELKQTEPTSAEHEQELKQRITEVKLRLSKFKSNLRNALFLQKKKESTAAAAGPAKRVEHEAEVERAARAPRRMDPAKHRQRMRKRAEAEHAAAKEKLEAAQKELAGLRGRRPSSDTEAKLFTKREIELRAQVRVLQSDYDRVNAILTWEKEFAELEAGAPSSSEQQLDVEQKKQELAGKIASERHKRTRRIYDRKRRGDPEELERIREADREGRKRLYRTVDYVADDERPRDTLDLLEEELRARLEEAEPSSRDERIRHLTERIENLKSLAELRRNARNARQKASVARREREKLAASGDTQKIDERIARYEQRHGALRTEVAKAVVKAALLANLDGETRTKATREVERAHLQEMDRELREGTLDERRLTEIEQALAEYEPFDAAYLEEIWREAGAEQASTHQAVRDEAEDVDAELLAFAEALLMTPSPERTAAVESGLQRLQNELRDERAAVDTADFALANEHAFLSQTLGQPGSSRPSAGAQRLAQVQQERIQLRAQWRERMQRRLDEARQQLQSLRSGVQSGDPAVEADLARQIALLEHEVSD